MYLLHEHDEEGRLCCATVARDSEHLTPELLAFTHLLLVLESSVDVVKIARSLQLRRTELAQGVVRSLVAVSDHVPSGGLRAEVDLCTDEHGTMILLVSVPGFVGMDLRNCSNAKHQSPVEAWEVGRRGDIHERNRRDIPWYH